MAESIRRSYSEFVGVVADVLDRLNIDYGIAGSFASSQYGEPRQTLDVDLTLHLQPVDENEIPWGQMIHYEPIVYWSKEDNAFIVEVPELPGCMADGATYQEAIANVEVIIHEWIDTARELGRPIPEPHGRLVYA